MRSLKGHRQKTSHKLLVIFWYELLSYIYSVDNDHLYAHRMESLSREGIVAFQAAVGQTIECCSRA